MRIAICDDEKEIREMLAEKVKRLFPEAELNEYQSGEALLSSEKKPDILLLDIRLSCAAGTGTQTQMPGKDGMEIAGKLRRSDKGTIIIFVTALEDYVFQAFDVGAFHYLVKPFADEKLKEVLQSAAEQFAERKRLEAAARKKEAPSLIVTAGGKHITVDLEDIVYAEVYNRKVILHTMDSDIEYYGKMKELEQQAGDEFFRTHRSYLVNFNYVRKYDAAAVYLKKGQALMAKQNYPEFVKCYLRYNQKKGRE